MIVCVDVDVRDVRVFGVLQRLALTYCIVASTELCCPASSDEHTVCTKRHHHHHHHHHHHFIRQNYTYIKTCKRTQLARHTRLKKHLQYP